MVINPELHPLPEVLSSGGILVLRVLLHFGATVEECAWLEFVWSAPLPESTALPLLLVAQQQHHHRCCSCSSLQLAVAHRVVCRNTTQAASKTASVSESTRGQNAYSLPVCYWAHFVLFIGLKGSLLLMHSSETGLQPAAAGRVGWIWFFGSKTRVLRLNVTIMAASIVTENTLLLTVIS